MRPTEGRHGHFWRTLKIAKVAGVPLAMALHKGTLARTDYARIVTKCRRCGKAAQCEALLATQQTRDTIPDFCPNREALEALKDKAE